MTQGIFWQIKGLLNASMEVVTNEGTDTYTWSGRDRATGYEIIDDFNTWANSGSRPWTGTFTLTPTVNGNKLYCALSYSGFTFTSLTPNAGFTLATGINNLVSFENINSTSAIEFFLRNWTSTDLSSGGSSRTGSWINGSRVYGLKRPIIVGYAEPEEFQDFNTSIEYAAQPRKAHIYDSVAATWRLVHVGTITYAQEQGYTSISMEALG